jgi:multidrug efflux pump subunit AcrB
MNIAESAIKHKTVTLVGVALIVLGGLWSYSNLGRLEDPEFTIKEAQVITTYPGASASEVAEEVTDRIEEAIQEMGQLKLLTSISEPGRSTIRVEVEDRFDRESLPQVWDELRRKVNDVQLQLQELPGVGPSVVIDDFGDVYGVFIAVYGEGYTYAELSDYVRFLRTELSRVDDVAKVVAYGEQTEVIYVEISRGRMAQLGVSPEELQASLAGQNLVTPGGHVEVDDLYLRIEPTGRFRSVEEIGNLVIQQQDAGGTRLYLRDIATISRGYAEPPGTIMRYNGQPAIGLGISTVEGGNVVRMGEALRQRLQELEPQRPVGMEIGVIAVQSEAVTTAVNGFILSLGQALVIVIGVLIVAMGLASGLLIGVILLLTVLGTFIIMYMRGVMLERISLGALIIALGMLVDNAIVVVEGILVNLRRGMSKIEAASQIVGQTIWPLLGATVVAVLAFAAIGVSQDSTGEYCRSLFQVILYSLMLSWLLAVTVTPLLGTMILKAKPGDAGKDPYGGIIFGAYKWLLKGCLKFKWMTVLILIAMLILAGWGFGFVDQSFFPDSTRPQFMVHYWMPQGTYITETDERIAALSEFVSSIDGVTNVAGFVGQGSMRFLLTYSPEDANSAYGMLLVSVDDYREIPDIMRQIDEHIAEHSHDTHEDAQVFSRTFILGPGDPQKIHARIRGRDPRILRQIERNVIDLMRADGNVTDMLSDWHQPVMMIQPDVAMTQANNAGIRAADVANAYQRATEGRPFGVYREDNDLLPILMRSPAIERQDVDDLNYLQIWSPVARRAIPIQQTVLGNRVQMEETCIRRRDRLPTITVMGDPAEGPASTLQARLIRTFDEQLELPEGYTLEWGGEYENSNDAQNALKGSLVVAFLLMVLTVVVLFDSIGKPLVIFLTVPLAIIGVTVGLLVTHQPFGFMALLGFLSLSGMLIKNAIVLIDEINAQLAGGAKPYDAVVTAGVSRARPVSMAALTTVLGMIPLLPDAFFVAMAVTIMFGLSFATVLTLVVVPVLYSIFYRVKT